MRQGEDKLFATERGIPEGAAASPLLSNILLAPFDREMRGRGYQLKRFADDWAITCESAAQVRDALAAARRIPNELDVQPHPQKTRNMHVRYGFEFLEYKIKRGKQLRLPLSKIRSGARSGTLYAFPKGKSIWRFMDRMRQLTRRCVALHTKEWVGQLNPLLRD